MRKLLILLAIALGFMLSVVSCSKTEEQLPLFNFGSSIYDEPFVGLLKSKPSLLTKSIQYPPFSWVTSDTICLEKTLEITFNEECVRSKSEAIIQFKDSLYKPINGVRIYCNGEIAENGDFTIVADSLVKALSIKCMISPSVGDSIIHGIILIQGKELDVVNGETLQQDNNVIANWECEQEIGWPVLLWLLWLVVFISIVAGIILVLYNLRIIIKSSHIKVASTNLTRTINKSPKKTSNNQKNWRDRIRRKTGWSDEIILNLSSESEALIYIDAGLKERNIAGRPALIQPNIKGKSFNCRKEWLKTTLKDYEKWKDYNNDDLMGEGYPPRDENGDPYELHHIGQHQYSPFAELTWSQHMDGGNNMILHPIRESEIDRQKFESEKGTHWMARSGYNK